ncbi:alpha/beta-Hydrolases superfamily protein [Perilla frutescens var. hirtella]|uniref:Alpha/beta-Hydrolases superfamily protein n=1 Tax=Perilla frutescens var. hirtella TaxID=608512 RepID=A0AAD4NX31_PERFH|nr:alpha/beta-Hydrolases superfamily protein [Perilla frutescens var. hirtella]
MAVLLEDIVKSVEHLLKLISKASEEQTYVDPTLDPVLLVPGIAGSILNAVDNKTGQTERVWVRILGADHEFQDKLWSSFNPATGKTECLDADTHIEIPQERHGLHAIDMLDPDMIIGSECVYYFHDMIVEFIKWGYQEGTTLFGFGYDFRQSNRLQETMDRLAAKLESVYTASGGRKINIISHSMGGLLTKCFMSLHTDIFEKYVKSWIAIAAPFQGAPGYITSTFLNGASFVEGWEQNFFISKWSMQQLLLECPSIYELMASLDFKWEHVPLLEIWRKRSDGDGNSTTVLESYPPVEAIPIFMEALSENKINYNGVDMSVPFNLEILNWANETRKLLSSAELPQQIKFYNIYGTNNETPHCVCYGSDDAPVTDLREVPTLEAKYINVDGDGTVPLESAKADGLRAIARVGVPGDHRGILCERQVFRILKHWLRADHDPFYNPINDYVILPTAFEMESITTKGMQVTSLREEWEIVGDDDGNDCKENTTTEKEPLPLVGSFTVACSSGDKSAQEEARATVTIQSQNDGKKHVELNAVSISASA